MSLTVNPTLWPGAPQSGVKELKTRGFSLKSKGYEPHIGHPNF